MTAPWVQPIDARSAASVLLYCFAHAGGGAGFFRPWRAVLPPTIELCPVVLPGRESRIREWPYTSVTQLVPPLAAVLERHVDRPYALLGHSMGAVVAYEVARRLAGGPAGEPGRLFVSGRRAPHLPARRTPLHNLPLPQFMLAVEKLGGTPAEVLSQHDLMRVFLPGLRADFTLNETYNPLPGPLLHCSISALTGDADPEVDPDEMRPWMDVTTGPFSLRVFPGDHFYLTGPPLAVANALVHDLRATQQATDQGWAKY